MKEKSIAHQKAVQERWHPTIPKATHSGILNIGGTEIECDVLQDGRRVLRHKTFSKAMGKGKPGNAEMKRALELKIPVFVCANNLTSYLEPIIAERGAQIFYKGIDGRKLIGYDAQILPEACKMYVKALNDDKLMPNQIPIAKICQTMLYGLATVGITALVDSATGYEIVRERNELEKILEKYIAQELRAWTKKFPDEFFKQIYRLYKWEYPKKTNHPQCVGDFINKYIYRRLPPGVLEELKRKNPPSENGNRLYKHHQFISEKIGDDNLDKQIVRTITVMKVSEDMENFKEFMEKLG